jgi:hypothetical protein
VSRASKRIQIGSKLATVRFIGLIYRIKIRRAAVVVLAPQALPVQLVLQALQACRVLPALLVQQV